MHKCSCGKPFHRLYLLQRHRGICEILRQNNNIQENCMQEIDDLPPLTELWSIVKTLVIENQKLQFQMNNMKIWIRKQKKHVNVIDWLNNNYISNISYCEWKEFLQINDDDLHLIFNHGFILGIFYILQNNLSLNNQDILPIRGFDQKPNVLFVCNNKKWRMIDNKEFKNLISEIQKKIMEHFKIWMDRNQKMINNTDNNDEWHNNLIKVMGGKYPYEEAVRRINSKLYKYLKFDLKNIIQYEFS